jgi:hypothetical protein
MRCAVCSSVGPSPVERCDRRGDVDVTARVLGICGTSVERHGEAHRASAHDAPERGRLRVILLDPASGLQIATEILSYP